MHAARYDLLTTLDLAAGELYPLEVQRAAQLRALYGDVWMTQTGEAADLFLRAGDSVALAPGARSLIGAAAPSRVEVVTHWAAL
jgi:hypothetical protein